MAQIHTRKKQHIEVIKKNQVEPYPSSFDFYKLPYCALPEIDMHKINTNCDFMGFKLSQPLIISSMTGGEKYGQTINTNIAKAAQSEKVAFGLGSMRVLDRYPDVIKTFDVKKYCPDVPMFANLGIVQLNYGFDYDKIQKLIDLVKADGIFLHLNHLQEAIQLEGDTNFENLLPKLEKLLKRLNVPLIVKEAGHGIDFKSAERLKSIGVRWIDVSGTGGTSWAWIEAYRQSDQAGDIFKGEGIPTTECLTKIKGVKGLNMIAGGGIRNGLHVAKAIAMGAKFATSAKPFMHTALESEESVQNLLRKFKKELIIAMFVCGVDNLAQLSKIKLEKFNPETGLN